MIKDNSLPGNRRILAIILILALAAFIAGLFVNVTRDSSKYATVAREVFETGDLIHLKVHGEPYLQKPPMLFWLSALSFRLFGLSDFAFRLPLLLLSFAGLYFTFRLGKAIYGRDTGIIAAFLLGTSQVFFLYNMDIHTDTLLQVFVTFSLWQLYEFIRNDKTINLLLGFTGIGLAMLTKGPAGAVIPAFAVVGHLVLKGKGKKLGDWRWYAGTILAFGILTPALVGLYDQFGWEGIRFFFWENNAGRVAGRFTSNDFNPLFYVVNLIPMFLPWMFMLFLSLFYSLRSLIKRKFRSREWFVFSGTWIFFLILSFSMDKLPNYIYSLMPLFALTTARYAKLALTGRKSLLYRLLSQLQLVASGVVVAVIVVVSVWFFPPDAVWQYIFLISVVVWASYLWVTLKEGTGKLLFPSAILVAALNFYINQHAAPIIFSDQAPVKAAKIFNSEAREGDRLYNYNYFSHELFFYSKIPVTQLRNDVRLNELMHERGTWVLTTGEVKDRILHLIPPPEIIPLTHVWMNSLNFEYMNPATRQQARDTLYLLRSYKDQP